jgi:hypothetical protein
MICCQDDCMLSWRMWQLPDGSVVYVLTETGSSASCSETVVAASAGITASDDAVS